MSIVVGDSQEIAIAIFIETGPLPPRDGYGLTAALSEEFSPRIAYDLAIHLSPRGVNIVIAGPYDDLMKAAIQELKSISSWIQNYRQDEQSRRPVDTQLLLAGLMSHSFDIPFSKTNLAGSPFLVRVACGNQASSNAQEIADDVQRQLQEHFGTFISQHNDTYPSVADFDALRRWIHIPGRSGTIIRLYRPLSAPHDRNEALSRSLGNAIVGGIGTSVLAQTLRDEYQISYSPYSALITQVGLQWLVVEVDTTTGFEQELISRLQELMTAGFDAEFTSRSVKSAAQFMIRQRRVAAHDPSLALQLELAKYDGSDPWHITNANLDEFLHIDLPYIRQITNELFTYDAMSLIGISNLQEQEVFSNA